MKYFIYLTHQILIVLIVLSYGCQQADVPDSSVRIGLITYVDEHKNTVGTPTLNAAQMAVDEVNAAGGLMIKQHRRQVELVVEGISSSPQNAVAATRKMTNRENVVAIIGLQYSLDAIPAGAFAEKAHIPLISPMSTNRLTTENRKYVFRMSFVDELQGAVMARYAYHDLGARRAAVIFDRTDPYSSGISDVFSTVFLDMGGAVVSYLSVAGQVGDYRPLIEQLRISNPDVLYLPGFATDVLEQVREIRTHGLEVQLLGADGWNVEQFSADKNFSGAFLTTHWMIGMNAPGVDRFVESYRGRFNQDPSAVAALTYDSMNILFKAIQEADNINGDSIRQALMEMKPFEGVTGRIDFVTNGDPVKGVVVVKIEDKALMFKGIVHQEGSRR